MAIAENHYGKGKPEKHCTSLSCPERFSLCCYSICEVDTSDNIFRCSMCKKTFQGHPCTAGNTPTEISKNIVRMEIDKSLRENTFSMVTKNADENEKLCNELIDKNLREAYDNLSTKSCMNDKDWLKFINEQKYLSTIGNSENVNIHEKEVLTEILKRLEYNSHDFGEMGKFVRLEYIRNIFKDYE